MSPIAIIANFLGRARTPWIIEQHRDSLLLNVPKLQALAALPSTPWVLLDFAILDRRGDNGKFFVRDTWIAGILHRFARRCVGTGGHCNASGRTHTNAYTSRSDTFPLMNSPALPDFLSPLSCFSP